MLMAFVSLCLICCLWHETVALPPLSSREGTVSQDSMAPDLGWAWREIARGMSGTQVWF